VKFTGLFERHIDLQGTFMLMLCLTSQMKRQNKDHYRKKLNYKSLR